MIKRLLVRFPHVGIEYRHFEHIVTTMVFFEIVLEHGMHYIVVAVHYIALIA